MKKILVCLLVLTILLTGCKNKEKTIQEKPNTMYSFNRLYFNLPEDYIKKTDDYYFINKEENGLKEVISVEFRLNQNVEDDIETFIEKDSSWFPNINSIVPIDINTKTWYKVNGEIGGFLYYIKDGSDVYSIMINPLITTNNRVYDTIGILEGNLILIK